MTVKEVLAKENNLKQRIADLRKSSADKIAAVRQIENQLAAHKAARHSLEGYVRQLTNSLYDALVKQQMDFWKSIYDGNAHRRSEYETQIKALEPLYAQLYAYHILLDISKTKGFNCYKKFEHQCAMTPLLDYALQQLPVIAIQRKKYSPFHRSYFTDLGVAEVKRILQTTREKRRCITDCPMRKNNEPSNQTCIDRQVLQSLWLIYRNNLYGNDGVSIKTGDFTSFRSQLVSKQEATEPLRRTVELWEKGFRTFAEQMDNDLRNGANKYIHTGFFRNFNYAERAVKETMEGVRLQHVFPSQLQAYKNDPLQKECGGQLRDVMASMTERQVADTIVKRLLKKGLFISSSKECKEEFLRELTGNLDYNETCVTRKANELTNGLRSSYATLEMEIGTLMQELEQQGDKALKAAIRDEEKADPAIWLPEAESPEGYAAIIAKIGQLAQARYTMPFISDMGWQNTSEQRSNNLYTLCRVRKGASPDLVEESRDFAVNRLLLKILLAFPIGKVHVFVVDLQMRGLYSQMLNRIDASLSANIINPADLSSALSELEAQVAYVTTITKNVLAYNEQEHQVVVPYQIVVLDGCAEQLTNDRASGERWMRLIQIGYRYGIHFISTEDFSDSPSLSEYFSPYRDLVVYAEFHQPYFDYINQTLHQQATQSLIQPTWQTGLAFEAAPAGIGTEIAIPFGDYGNHQVAECVFNDANPQAILIGQTGSGKSYLMHTLLLNAMLRYSSRFLEIYLMDFKLGAPEFNGYKDFPHVSHLLADGSDRRVVYEVLAGLYERMNRRNKLMAEHGCRNISDYNRALAPGREPMRRILLVVDECHNLFESQSSERTLQDQITSIIERIAAEGRSQGVHFLLGTQTLANTQIPLKVINNISNRFLMQCSDVDAEKLVDKGSQKVKRLLQGQVYHRTADKTARVYNYAPFAEKAKAAILSHNTAPTDATRFFFSGKIMNSMQPDNELFRQSRYPIALLGKSISVKQTDVAARFKHDMGQNLLIVGINDQMQAERVLYGAIRSLWDSCRQKDRACNIVLIDNFDEDDDLYIRRAPILERLGEQCNLRVVTGRRRKDVIVELAAKARQGGTGQTEVLTILGKERMRRLLNEPAATFAPTAEIGDDSTRGRGMRRFGGASFTGNSPFQPINADLREKTSGSASAAYQPRGTVEDELRFLLANGPESGIYTLMQVGRPAAIFSNENATRSEIQQMFCHIVMLKMPDREAVSRLPIDGSTSLEQLPADNDRLRAYYYNDEKATLELITPYTLPQ